MNLNRMWPDYARGKDRRARTDAFNEGNAGILHNIKRRITKEVQSLHKDSFDPEGAGRVLCALEKIAKQIDINVWED